MPEEARAAMSDGAASPSEDPLERLARDGIAALERFGAELEAVFAGQRAPAAATGSAAPSPDATSAPRRPPSSGPAPARGSLRSRLATVEAELERRLVDEGLVVRGHDIARVIAVATGQPVAWTG